MGRVLFQNGIRHNLNVCRPLAGKVEKSYIFHNFTINTARQYIGKRTRQLRPVTLNWINSTDIFAAGNAFAKPGLLTVTFT